MQECNLINMLDKLKFNNERGIYFIESRNEETFISYKALYESARYRLFDLQKKGLKPKDKIILQVDKNSDFIVNFWACLLGGIIPIPCSLNDNEQQKMKILKIYEISNNPFVLLSQEKWSILKRFLEDIIASSEIEKFTNSVIVSNYLLNDTSYGEIANTTSDDTAFIQFSSGSTGTPKGVVLSNKNILINLEDSIVRAETTNADSSINWMPLTHDLGLIQIHLGSIYARIDQYIMTSQLFLKRPVLWMEKVSQHKITQLYTTNYGIKLFLDAFEKNSEVNWDLKNVRFILNAAEPISPTLCKEFLNKMGKYRLSELAMIPAYGLAEATVGAAGHGINHPLTIYKLDRNNLLIGNRIKEVDHQNGVEFLEIGPPLDNTAIRICDSNDTVLDDNYIGRIQIKGGNVTKGYLNEEGTSNGLFTNDGWLNTGDVGFINMNNIIVTGREKDLLIINGMNYYPHDIERIAESTNVIGLNKVAATGVYNPHLYKDELIIFVVFKRKLKEFFEISELIKRTVSKKIGFEVTEVIPVKSIPKTTSGKLQRFQLKEQFENGLYKEIIDELTLLRKDAFKNEYKVHHYSSLEKDVLKIWMEIVGHSYIELEDDFFEIGGDSMKAIKMIDEINSKFGLEIEPSQLLDEVKTPKEMSTYIRSNSSEYLKDKEEKVIEFNF
ncbi:non-ribosomal peptide synthetase [Paenibacillus odorifer]|uniref:non-ribosomal peptide synthetase n=2 Tax=Paenibacillus TaxID=44249 RepID=UPI00096CB812|nr:non-ribosomal peptide synthetase [Paenibacillus odorifer]MEC0134711.1 non-ribosomal peptide synthetase [Paenibacillus odorifer]MEC0221931.1 non-ribosomal peptide synthetase [Paenibacillus odorifer]OME48697.1 hypothetical protein BSK59_25910 [Paenibacillus odorifer]